jgi:hypothetical protein
MGGGGVSAWWERGGGGKGSRPAARAHVTLALLSTDRAGRSLRRLDEAPHGLTAAIDDPVLLLRQEH